MERIIHHQLVAALESQQLINDSQHGFQHKRSTISLLLSAVNNWAGCLENRNSVHCVLLDLAKAFDSFLTVNFCLSWNAWVSVEIPFMV